MGLVCTVALLGGFAVSVNGDPVSPDAWRSRRAADLVKLLALAPGRRLHREQVTDSLWPDLPAEAGAANLRKAVHFARRATGSASVIVSADDLLALWPEAEVVIDAEEFDAAAARALQSGQAGQCAAAAQLYQGELLPQNRYDEWTSRRRDQLRDRHLSLLRAAGLWTALLAQEPLDEAAHRALMRADLDAGNRGAVLRRFAHLTSLLREEFGVDPSAATYALYQEATAAVTSDAQQPAPVAEVRALLAQALVAWNRGDHATVETAAGRARVLALPHHLAQELGEASGLLARVAYARGRWPALFRQEFAQLVQVGPELAAAAFDALLCFAEFDLYGVNGSAEAGALAAELLPLARDHHSVVGEAIVRLMLGEVDLLAGRLEEAGRQLTASANLHQAAGCRSGQALAEQRLAEVALAAGQVAPVTRLLERAEQHASASPAAAHLLVRILGTRIELAERDGRGLAVLTQAERALDRCPACEPCSMGFLVNAAIASARAGELARAERHLAQGERIAGMWQGDAWQAAIWEARAALRSASGEAAQAAALLREAATGYARAGRPVDAARCRPLAAASNRPQAASP